MKAREKFAVTPRSHVNLAKCDPNDTGSYHHEHEAADELAKHVTRLCELQDVLWAERKWALLILLQAMDAGGKDGTIRHVMSGVNPQGCRVTSFKVPSAEEADHDFLWRHHLAVPGPGRDRYS